MFISHLLCLSWFLIFCLFILSSARRRIVKSVTIIIELYIYSFDSVKFFTCFIYDCYIFLMNRNFNHFEMPLSLVIYYSLKSILSYHNIVAPALLWLVFIRFVFFLPFTFELPTLLPVNYLKNVCILSSHSYLCENRNPDSKKGNASTRRHNKFSLHKGKNCSSASNGHKKLTLRLYPEDREAYNCKP